MLQDESTDSGPVASFSFLFNIYNFIIILYIYMRVACIPCARMHAWRRASSAGGRGLPFYAYGGIPEDVSLISHGRYVNHTPALLHVRCEWAGRETGDY